jgi:hypothetical protein
MIILIEGSLEHGFAEIDGSIERINQEPLDLADIAKFWKGRSESAPLSGREY